MRIRLLLPLVAMVLGGCGYPGEPYPPALRRPVPVSDLAVIQRGTKLYMRFTVPSTTTEGIVLKEAPELDIRVGPPPQGGWNQDVWAGSAIRVPADSIKVAKNVASVEFPVEPIIGKSVIVGVRVLGPKGVSLGWSNLESLAIVQPLPTPLGLTAKDGPDSVLLDWHATAPEFRVFRREVGVVDWTFAGSSPRASYADPDVVYGKEYEYFVQSVEKAGERYAESEVSEFLKFKPTDRFPPVAPSGLSVIIGTKSVELVWDRNGERDFASYRVYRDGKMIAEGIAAPSYSDAAVVNGRKYSYRVSALDTAGNESAKSVAVEALIP